MAYSNLPFGGVLTSKKRFYLCREIFLCPLTKRRGQIFGRIALTIGPAFFSYLARLLFI
jgi:hypothetical protein